jgi:hypothetical protein
LVSKILKPLSTQEVEIERIMVQGQTLQKVSETKNFAGYHLNK